MRKKVIVASFIVLWILFLLGGLLFVLFVPMHKYGEAYDQVDFLTFPLLVLSLVSVLPLIEFISFLKVDTTGFRNVVFALMLFLMFLFSSDMQPLLNPSRNQTLSDVSSILFFAGFMAFVLTAICVLENHIGAEFSYIRFALSSIYAGLTLLSFVFLDRARIPYFALVIFLPLVVYLIISVFMRGEKPKFNTVTFVLVGVVCLSFGLCLASFASKALGKGDFGVTTFYVLLIFLSYMAVYIDYIIRREHDRYMVKRYAKSLEKAKSRLLTSQMNPHFVFNSLLVIKDTYHQDIAKGDQAMDLFSKYLRTSVESLDKDFVTFEDELQNIANFIALEEIKKGKSYNIIYDIDVSDFVVPILSLETLVENSLKYSMIEDKEDGEIIISTKEENGTITITIEDNGIGFNPEDIKKGSYGLKNTSDRFHILLQAKTEIKSKPNEGTKIEITFNKEEANMERIIEGGGFKI